MRGVSLRDRLALLACVVMVGLNLRPFLTAAGPLSLEVRDGSGLGHMGLSMLTLVPMLLMGLGAFGGPALQGRFGARRAVLCALGMLAIGSALRLAPLGGGALVGTAALCGLGAAIVQAVFPGVIKRQFPSAAGMVTGLYSAMLMGGGAMGAQAAPVVARASGNWRLGLAWISGLAVAAVALAAWRLPRDARGGAKPDVRVLLRLPRPWLLMACFGLVNGGYASVVAWLAPAYQERGWSGSAGGALLAVLAVSQAIFALVLPLMASRSPDKRLWLWLTLVLQGVGFAGLAVAPTAAPFGWAMLLGAGLGGCFSLMLGVALEHLPDPAQAGALSALMQGGGFLLAAVPPGLLALLRDATGGFAAGWWLHLGCVLLATALVARLSAKGYAQAMSGRAPHGSGGGYRLGLLTCKHGGGRDMETAHARKDQAHL